MVIKFCAKVKKSIVRWLTRYKVQSNKVNPLISEQEDIEGREKFRRDWSRIKGRRLTLEEARHAAQLSYDTNNIQKLAWAFTLLTINNPTTGTSLEQNPSSLERSFALPPELPDAEDLFSMTQHQSS
jgi:hypothetical protein